MANVIIFTDRMPLTRNVEGENFQIERFSRPAGAYKIASVLRQQGYTVQVVPNCLRLTFSAIKDYIRANSKGLLWVGISTSFFTIKSNRINEYRQEWAESARQFIDLDILENNHYIQSAPTQLAWGTDELSILSNYLNSNYNAKLLVGGSWVSHIQHGGLNINDNNIIFTRGHAEDFVLQLSSALATSRPVPRYLEGDSRFKSSSICYTPHDHLAENEWASIEISRGCAFRCAYCTYDHKGKDDTTKHSQALRDELIRNYELYGITKYHLLDDLYNDSDNKVKRLYDEVWSKLPFTPEWISYLRLDLIWSNPDSAQWLKESGCKLGCFGIETLHDRAGRGVGKGLGKTRIIETLSYLKEVWGDEVLVNALMIAGLPDEPFEHIVETMDWLQKTDLVHSYKYSALWVTPPAHKVFVLKQNDISNDYERYGLTWGDDGWVNNQNVSFKMVSKLVEENDKEYFQGHYPVDLIEYPELRTAGFTHNQLANKEENSKILDSIKNKDYPINNLITERLDNILKTSD